MTPEEAIKTIQVAIAEVEWEYPMNYSVAFETAIKALDKQIPKMPINEECYYVCPCCRGDLGVSDDDIFIYELSMPKYCSNCGCVLDWTEVKNE
nr:MAG TPA: TFIIB zinc-binding [Myoviridae sp. ct5FH28]